MARLCTNCGKPLPRDDARFCNNCGSVTVSPNEPGVAPFNVATSAERRSMPDGGARPPLKEQIAFPAQPPGRPSWPGPPSNPGSTPWVNRPENSVAPVSPAPLRELRIKVWDAPDVPGTANGLSSSNQQAAAAPVSPGAGEQNETDLEHLPTSRLSVPPASAGAAPTFGPAQRGIEASPDSTDGRYRQGQAVRERQVYSDGVEQLETRPMRSQRGGSPQLPPAEQHAAPYTAQQPWEAQPPLPVSPPWQMPGGEAGMQSPVMQRPVTPSLPISKPGIQPAQPLRPIQPAQPFQAAFPEPASSPPTRRSGKTRLAVILALLVLFLAGGVVTWLIVASPFTVPAVTQTTVSFQNASLGVSLQYPRGWTAQLDTQHGAASFFDPNHTDQVDLNTNSNSGLSINQYIKNTTDQLGMTGQKNLSPLNFAGQAWQQVRGSVQKSGATFTETLLVTTHAGRLYALLLMAPASTYANADRLFFAPLRSSFKFS